MSRPAFALGLAHLFVLSAPLAAQVGENYCSPVNNSTGLPALLSARGSANVNLNDITLECRQLPAGAAGYFLASLARGFATGPGGSTGNLCLGGSIGRYVNSVQTTGPNGTVELSVDVSAVPSPGGFFAIAPGTSVAFQYWHRDTSPQGAASNFSDGLEIEFADRCALGSGFFPGSRFPAGIGGTGLAAGDIDGDGIDDLVGLDLAQSRALLYFGDGNARFQGPVGVPLGGQPAVVRLGDLDGDGDLDFVIVNRDGGGSLSIYVNLGGGTFGAPTSLTAGTSPRDLALADIDADGDLDALVSNGSFLEVNTFLNDGAAGFTFQGSTDLPVSSVLRAADINGDGNLDLVGGGGSGIQTRLSDGAGGYAPAVFTATSRSVTDIVVADVDGDALPDLLLGQRPGTTALMLPGNGDGTFGAERSIETLGSATSLAYADLSGDGDLDLVVSGDFDESGVRLLTGDGSGSFAAPAILESLSLTRSLVVFETQPGRQLAVAATVPDVGDIVVATVDPDGEPSAASELDLAERSLLVAAEDLDGDGILDLLSGQAGSMISISRGRGDGTFEPEEVIAIIPTAVDVAFGDLDGDGDTDLAFSSGFSNLSVSLLYNQGNGMFGGRVDLAGPLQTPRIRLGDIDGDGDLDLAILDGGGFQSTRVGSYINSGTGGFQPGATRAIPLGANTLSLADIDLDGDLDAVTLSQTGVVIVPNSGQGLWEPPVVVPSQGSATSLELVDLDGDGDQDVVTIAGAGIATQENLLGLSFGTPNIALGDGAQLTEFALGDVDLDGLTDVIALGQDVDSAALFLGAGGLGFAFSGRYSTARSPGALLLRDLNGDGRLDLVSAGLSNRLAISLGICR